MDNNEGDIRRFLETEAALAPKPTAIPATTVRKARLKRAGFLLSSVVGVGILTGGVAVGVTALRDDAPHVSPADPDQTPTPERATTARGNENLGLAITTPTEWAIQWSKPPQSTTLYVATYGFDRGSGFCGKQGLLSTMPADGAFFWMYEFDRPNAAPRPDSFTLDEQSFNPYEGSGCVMTYRIEFSDSGRNFVIHVAFGADASEELRAEVLQALDSLEVDPSP